MYNNTESRRPFFPSATPTGEGAGPGLGPSLADVATAVSKRRGAVRVSPFVGAAAISEGSARAGTFRRVLGLFGAYRPRIALLGLVVLVTAALQTAVPLLTKVVFDKALFPPAGQPRMGLLAVLVGTMIVLSALAGCLTVVQTYFSSAISQNVMHDLRKRLYGHLQRMSLRFFTATRTGELQARLAQDIGGLEPVITSAFATVLSQVALVILTVAGMAVLSWQLTLLTLLLVPPFVYFSHRIGMVKRGIQRTTQELIADMSVQTQETLSVSGFLLGRIFHRQRSAVQRYHSDSRRLADLRVRQQMVGRLFLGLAQSVFLVTPGVTYLAAGLARSHGTGAGITAGTLVAFTALQIRLFGPFRALLLAYTDALSSMALFERIFAVLDLRHDVEDAPHARTLVSESVAGRLSFRDVHFRYDEFGVGSSDPAVAARPWTLEAVDFEIEPGQMAAIVGPSGAGKTTLTYLVPRLYDVTSGAVCIDGTNVRDIRLSSLAQTVGMVTQEPYLFHASVLDNLLYARPGATREEVEAAARAAHIHETIMELSDGYDTRVGERGYRMSGGEKQRLAIARAILKDPRILILDEATSSLDTTNERLVQTALATLLEGRTTVVIAHRLATVVAADVIFVLERGRLVQRGTHRELLAAGGLYAQLCRDQLQSGDVAAAEGDTGATRHE